MRNVRVLDCTLRDGGRIIDCAFPDTEILSIARGLVDAKIDIIEMGFLRDAAKVTYKSNSTFFTDVNQIAPFVDRERKDVLYTAFIDYGMFDFSTLTPFDGTSIDAIRFGFTKKDYLTNKEDVIRSIGIIKEKGYLAFVQGVNSLNYSDKEILELVEMIDEVEPYSFGIVDTYGAMYIEDVDRIYRLIDHNMQPDICINFHSHNNYQPSFAFAQEVVKLSRGSRKVIVDGTLGGMGKVAGNLNTELFVNYLVRELHYDYEMDILFDLLDDFIAPYAIEHSWGYSTPAMMAGIYKSHPNNVIYLMEKYRLDTKDIGNILSMIEPAKRQRYDYDNIERLYVEYMSNKVDDTKTIDDLRHLMEERDVLILVPGASLAEYRDEIDRHAKENDSLVISVNFVADDKKAWAFFGNQKRYALAKRKRCGRKIILSSNVKADEEGDTVTVNYHSLINRGYRFFDNSTMMLLNLLRRTEAKHISIAGLDGFSAAKDDNYVDASFQNIRYVQDFDALNDSLTAMLRDYAETMKGRCEISFVTPSRFSTLFEEALW